MLVKILRARIFGEAGFTIAKNPAGGEKKRYGPGGEFARRGAGKFAGKSWRWNGRLSPREVGRGGMEGGNVGRFRLAGMFLVLFGF